MLTRIFNYGTFGNDERTSHEEDRPLAQSNQGTQQTNQLHWIYLKKTLGMTPSLLISQMVQNLGCELKDAKSDDPDKLKEMLTKTLQKFEAIKRHNVRNGGEKLSEGFRTLAYQSPRFLFSENTDRPEFTRLLRVIEKWTSHEKAVGSFGSIKCVIDIANNLYNAWRENNIHSKDLHASREMRQVMETAENFIKDNGEKWLKEWKPKDRPTLSYVMVHGMPEEKFTANGNAQPQDTNRKGTRITQWEHEGFTPNSHGGSPV